MREKSRFFLVGAEIHNKVLRRAIEGEKEERTAEGEQSSLTVNGVMKEGGQTASDGL